MPGTVHVLAWRQGNSDFTATASPHWWSRNKHSTLEFSEYRLDLELNVFISYPIKACFNLNAIEIYTETNVSEIGFYESHWKLGEHSQHDEN